MALSSSEAGDGVSEEQRQYSRRCVVLREERQKREDALAEEAAAWDAVSAACISRCVAAWAEEEARWRARLMPPTPPPPYAFRFRAGTTESVLPPGEAGDGARALLRGGPGTPTHVAETQLSQWEQENRADLEAWESLDRSDMAGAMLHILTSQHQRDMAIRKRACRRVLKSATALEWVSYPQYRESRMLL